MRELYPADAVAAVTVDGKVLGCSRSLCDLLDLGPDPAAELERLLAQTRLVEEARERGYGRCLLAAGQGPPTPLRAERAQDLIFVQARPVEERSEGFRELVRRLAESTAHDARNPLNALSIHLELIAVRLREQPGELAAAALRHLETAREQITRVETVLKRFLRFASPPPDDGEVLDLADLVRQAVDMCGHQARRRGLAVQTALAPAYVRGAPGPLGEAVLRLTLSAIEASETNGVLAVELENQGAHAVLRLEGRSPDALACPLPVGAGAGGEPPLGTSARISELQRGEEDHPAREPVRLEMRLPLAAAAQARAGGRAVAEERGDARAGGTRRQRSVERR